jgi:lysozyme
MMADFEGVILHPYKDQVGIPTIGIGMTYYPSTGKKVTMADPAISLQQAYDMFAALSNTYCLAVYSVTRDDINQHQFNALVALCYNIGTGGFKNSTVLKLVNQNIADDRLKAAFLMWNKAGGKVNAGLSSRRLKEYAIYIS